MLGRVRKCCMACLFGLTASVAVGNEPIEITSSQAEGYYKNHTKKWVTCHDPSVVWDDATQKYYIFGSHLAQASTPDLQNWTTFRAPWGTVQADGAVYSGATNAAAFVTNQTKTVNVGGQEIVFGNFDAYDWVSAYGDGYNIDGPFF